MNYAHHYIHAYPKLRAHGVYLPGRVPTLHDIVCYCVYPFYVSLHSSRN